MTVRRNQAEYIYVAYDLQIRNNFALTFVVLARLPPSNRNSSIFSYPGRAPNLYCSRGRTVINTDIANEIFDV